MSKNAPLLMLMLMLMWGEGAEAQRAQRGWEWQAHGLLTFVTDSDRAGLDDTGRFLGGGAALGLRNTGRLRALVSASLGDRRGALAFRPEGSVTFLLNPYKRRGLTPYAGGGLAAVFTRDASAEYLLVVVGVEANPGASSGWFVEGGVGGGVRLAAGLRRRWRRNG